MQLCSVPVYFLNNLSNKQKKEVFFALEDYFKDKVYALVVKTVPLSGKKNKKGNYVSLLHRKTGKYLYLGSVKEVAEKGWESVIKEKTNLDIDAITIEFAKTYKKAMEEEKLINNPK